MAWVQVAMAAAQIGASLFGGSKAAKAQKRASEEASALQRESLAMQKEQIKKLDAFASRLTEQEQSQLSQLMGAYAQVRQMSEVAKNEGIAVAEEGFNDQIAAIQGYVTELTGLSEDFFSETDKFIDDSRAREKELVGGDIEYNRQLRDKFGVEMAKSMEAQELGLGTAVERLEMAKAGKLPPGAADKLARLDEKFDDLKHQIKREDAGRGQTGTTGKLLTAEIERIKGKGALSAQLQEGAEDKALADVGEASSRFANLSERQQAGLQETGGRIEAESSRFFDEQQRENERRTQQQQLNVTEFGGRQRLDAISRFGAEKLGQEIQFQRDRVASVLSQADAKIGLEDKFRSSRFSAITGIADQSNKISSSLGRHAEQLRQDSLASGLQARQSFQKFGQDAGRFAAGGAQKDGTFDFNKGARSVFFDDRETKKS